MKKFLLNFFGIWVLSSIFIVAVISSYKNKKADQIKKSFYAQAKLISKQRVDAGLRVISSFYTKSIENEKEKLLLTDKIIRKFNLNQNFSFYNIHTKFTLNKKLTPNYIFYKDVITENKIVYIYENINNIKQKIYSFIPDLFDAFRFGKRGYIFVYDDKGNCYYHYDKKFIGKNRWNLKRNGIYVLQLLIKKAKEFPNGTYVKYIAFNPDGKPAPKISYVVYFKPLNLLLGSGVYLEKLDSKLKELNKGLNQMIIEAEGSMTFILFIIFLMRRKID